MPTGKAPVSSDKVSDDGFCLVDSGTKDTTNANGTLTFPDLAIGLYYVQETDSSKATLNGEAVNVVSESAPFYVSIPLPNEGDWIYNVHAYPKNQLVDVPEKTINSDEDQTGLHVGSTVEWTIQQTVPKLNDGEAYETATIWDVLPADELAYKGTTSVKLDGTLLVEDTDYTIDTDGVTWSFTETGLGKLEAGQTIEVVFTTTVLKVTETGEIGNPGSDGTEPGYGSEFNGSTTPGGPTPYTYWGALKVTKEDQDGAKLSGAVFQIFPKTGDQCTADVPTEGLVSTGTSGADGVVTWTPNTLDKSSPLGLFVANSNDGPLDNPTKDYCLYETKVPAGYTGVGVQTVTISAGDELVVDVNDLTIKNIQKDGPDLPLTGAAGTFALMAGGVALLLAGASVYTISRRKA